jgi:predicted short-subunit dehydrogenase-like oxidoreductase (DUF2520 family)
MSYRISFIGAGKVASHLAPALSSAGNKIVQIISRSELSAQVIGERIGCQYSSSIVDLDKTVDILFLTVPDHSLIQLINDISDYRGLVIHTSGTFSPLRFACQKYKHGGLYPLQTFSAGRKIDMSQVPVFIEGSEPSITAKIRELAEGITKKVYEMSFEERRWLHLAAVWANNFSNHMLAEAFKILDYKGLDPEWLTPLVRETFEKALAIGPEKAQTGPAVRQDDLTLKKHMDMLKDFPIHQELYKVISNSVRFPEPVINKEEE